MKKTTVQHLSVGNLITAPKAGVRSSFIDQDGLGVSDRERMSHLERYEVAGITSKLQRGTATTGRSQRVYVIAFTNGRSIEAGTTQRFIVLN